MEAGVCGQTRPVIRVVLVDDHPLMRGAVRDALSLAPDIMVAGEAASARDGLKLAARTRADVAIVDYALPDGSGAYLASALKGATPTRVLMLSCHTEPSCVRDAVLSGADGYLGKVDADAETLVNAVRDVAVGRVVFSAGAAKAMARCVTGPEGRQGALTAREMEVWELMAEGNTNRAIAQKLFISERTVKFHVGNILCKTESSNRTEAVVRAYATGFLQRVGI